MQKVNKNVFLTLVNTEADVNLEVSSNLILNSDSAVLTVPVWESIA